MFRNDDASLLDTAPTIASILGIHPHHHWEGTVIDVFAKAVEDYPVAA
jgi:hypothetical protein